VVWRDRERVLVAGGLAAGERVVTSAIPTPVNGMRLRVVGGARRDERAEGPDDRVSKVGAGAESDASTAAPPVEGERP
jgi:hypothetical protein